MFPDYVAGLISEVPIVKDCSVVCIDDPEYKSIAVAFVVLKDEIDDKTAKNLILEHIEDVLPIYSIPKKICFIDVIPLTPIGKVDYRALEKVAEDTNYMPK